MREIKFVHHRHLRRPQVQAQARLRRHHRADHRILHIPLSLRYTRAAAGRCLIFFLAVTTARRHRIRRLPTTRIRRIRRLPMD